MFRKAAALAAFGPLFRLTGPASAAQSGGVNRNSAPADLKITDMRACRVSSNDD